MKTTSKSAFFKASGMCMLILLMGSILLSACQPKAEPSVSQKETSASAVEKDVAGTESDVDALESDEQEYNGGVDESIDQDLESLE